MKTIKAAKEEGRRRKKTNGRGVEAAKKSTRLEDKETHSLALRRLRADRQADGRPARRRRRSPKSLCGWASERRRRHPPSHHPRASGRLSRQSQLGVQAAATSSSAASSSSSAAAVTPMTTTPVPWPAPLSDAAMRAQYRAEARAEVEAEVRREWLARQPPLANSGDAGSSSSSDWEAAEAQLSFATKILIWSQNQHRQNALRLTLHKLPALENLQDKTIRIKRSEVKAHMLDLFGTGGQNGLKQWSGPPATRRLLQAIRIEYIDQLGDKEDGVDQGGLSADLYDSFCSEVLADRTLFDVSEDGSHLPRR